MEFFLLGPVRARLNRCEVFLGGEKQRTVLASLLLYDNHVLGNDRLTQLLWDFSPPTTASAQIHTYMSRLRMKLRPHITIVRQHQGYVLEADRAWVDYKEFNALAGRAHGELTEGEYDRAAVHFRRALALWRGAALCDVTQFLAEKVGPAWNEVRMATLEGRIVADLNLGRQAAVVPELTGLVHEYPYREELRAHLMTALYLCNRQTDALAVYSEGRRILADEVGVDPGEALVRTHRAVLAGHLRPEIVGQWRDRSIVLAGQSWPAPMIPV